MTSRVCVGFDWQRYGMGEPPEVRIATAGYRDEMDVLQDFLAECCVLDASAKVASQDLYAEYIRWATEAFTERRKSETEIKQADRYHRLEQANAFQKQAESIRQKIKENTRSQEQLVKRREEIEERMRLA